MFETLDSELSRQNSGRKFVIFEYHPVQLLGAIEAVWEGWRVVTPRPTLPESHLEGFSSLSMGAEGNATADGVLALALGATEDSSRPSMQASVQALLSTFRGRTPVANFWSHLIYAQLIESTRVFEIFRRVMHEVLHGEKLPPITQMAGQRWVNATEVLFFCENGPFVGSVTSALRPDAAAVRRNLYHRFFGMELPHGAADGRAYPFERSSVSNSDFVPTLESLFREVWRGIKNAQNQLAENETDTSAIAEHCSRLRSMLADRRRRGLTSREEFVAVATMNWFRYSLQDGSPILSALGISTATPEESLRRVGDAVGLASHGKARSLFKLAEHLPRILWMIEQDRFSSSADARLLFDSTSTEGIGDSMKEVVTHWSLATGKDLKAPPSTSMGIQRRSER